MIRVEGSQSMTNLLSYKIYNTKTKQKNNNLKNLDSSINNYNCQTFMVLPAEFSFFVSTTKHRKHNDRQIKQTEKELDYETYKEKRQKLEEAEQKFAKNLQNDREL